ncbi:CRISPR-associated helicase Cas3 [Desulfofundulus kuznetsovii DSM 6115]|uniref:CRISPR-associated helicase Cas3 n=1 Tax=Desulfofundulus kuznetsovii (strain DSM 6115 / VKM B-1805 / 17) TaxID=760568 RepID=A0AAU8PLE4_DESK7|nr:CRISPR-associated helicase Cas3 [Desulfofundulus kuznetsovii DSM 6115]
MSFLAKSNGVTLEKHIADVLASVRVLEQKNRECHPRELWRDLKLAAFLHDVGKVDPVFQQKLKSSVEEASRGASTISHNLISVFLINREKLLSYAQNPEAVLGAVAFHHWRDYYPDLFLGARGEEVSRMARSMLEEREMWEDLVNRLHHELQTLAHEYDIDPEVISFNKTWADYFQYNSIGNAGLLLPPYLLSFLPQKLKLRDIKDDQERIFLAGNLMRCDHFASLIETEDLDLSPEDIEHNLFPSTSELHRSLEEDFREKAAARNEPEPSFWQRDFFASAPDLREGSLVFIAPTGVGKTEFAYLWGAGRKNIYLLPMRAAVNAMWQRTRRAFGRAREDLTGHIAFLHGEAAMELRSAGRNPDLEGESLTRSLALARHLAEPYIIATGDQVAPAVLKYPGYERLYTVLMDSCLVVDEVQAYDPRAAAVVTKLLEDVHNLQGRVLLMTATLPPFIQEEISQRLRLSSDRILNFLETSFGKAFAGQVRHRLQFKVYRKKPAQTKLGYPDVVSFQVLMEEMVALARDGKKVLAVFNTVKAAQEAYDLASSLLDGVEGSPPLLLIHSRYTRTDRRENEKAIEDYMPNGRAPRLEKGCLVLATQVVEASLDIDADILYTELCPVDSLIQRLGRVWRRAARQASGMEEPSYANVYVLVETEDLCSGCGRVYDRHLVALTGFILARQAMGDLELMGEQSHIENLLADYRDIVFKKDRRRAYNPDEKENSALCKLLAKAPQFCLNELEKVRLVALTYGALTWSWKRGEKDVGSYLKEYYETLDILDSGYCSDRKYDAQRLFRQVYTVEVVPRKRIEEFGRKLKAFIERQDRPCYFDFNEQVLGNFTVPVDFRSLPSHAVTQPLAEVIDISFINARFARKIERWLQGIMVVPAHYDSQRGLVLEVGENGEE